MLNALSQFCSNAYEGNLSSQNPGVYYCRTAWRLASGELEEFKFRFICRLDRLTGEKSSTFFAEGVTLVVTGLDAKAASENVKGPELRCEGALRWNRRPIIAERRGTP